MHSDGLSVAGHDVTALQGTLLFHFLWRGWIPQSVFFLAISGDPKTNDVPTKNQNEPNVWDSLVGPTLQETPLVPFSSTMALSWQTQLLGDPDAKTIEGLQGHLGATAKHVGCDMGALSVCFWIG